MHTAQQAYGVPIRVSDAVPRMPRHTTYYELWLETLQTMRLAR